MAFAAMPNRTGWTVVLILFAVLLGGCGRETETPQAGQSVLVLAAASTAEALEAVGRQFHEETGIKVRINPAASNALAAQILAGAPADLFLSASRAWADNVQKAGQALAVRPLLSNDLVLVVPRGNPAGVTSPRDLASDRVPMVALAGEQVPAGQYAEQVLRSLGLYDNLVAQNRIARGQDVRSTLSYVERGEAEAGIVYATDAKLSDLVETITTLPADRHDEIVYPLVLLKESARNPAARRFHDYLFTEPARAVFRRYGFTPMSEKSVDDSGPGERGASVLRFGR